MKDEMATWFILKTVQVTLFVLSLIVHDAYFGSLILIGLMFSICLNLALYDHS